MLRNGMEEREKAKGRKTEGDIETGEGRRGEKKK